jgi:hypothetical protein
MSMMKNAVDSIWIGMEDFHDDDPRRAVSAIRNFYAGILLLFKCKLQELSPEGSGEVLLKKNILPIINSATGETTWVGSGNNTVEVREIKDRLKSLGVEGIDWHRLENLQKIRNNIEHYYSKDPVDQMKEAIASALHLIIQFCKPHLRKDPVQILGQECWDLLLGVASLYEAELKAAKESLESVDWPYPEVEDAIDYMRCPCCDSQLIKVVDPTALGSAIEFVCSSCGSNSSYATVIAAAIPESLEGANYVSVKDGGDSLIEDCPSCGEGTFLVGQGECAACLSELEYQACRQCHTGLTVDDQHFDGLCSYCSYIYGKMMADD